jgi:2-polyprenyl-6-methoxyphenol hydroxylase-like FAD-dependent oxidoreductase
MRLGRVDDPDAPAWRPIEGLPAGRYAVTVAGGGLTGATLAATIGRSRTPVQRTVLGGPSGHVAVLNLPAGAAVLTLALDPVSARAAQTIDIAPLAVDRSSQPPAVASLSSPGVDVFFFDQHVFVEDDGFWVRGGQATDVALAAEGTDRVVLTLANGAAANDVTVNDERLHLAPGETRDVVLHAAGPAALPVHIQSPAGFRPSDVSLSQDRRYLGVRVRARGEQVRS